MKTMEGLIGDGIITGATGFLGQKLTSALVKEGCNVILFTREKAGVSSGDRIDSLFNRRNSSPLAVGYMTT